MQKLWVLHHPPLNKRFHPQNRSEVVELYKMTKQSSKNKRKQDSEGPSQGSNGSKTRAIIVARIVIRAISAYLINTIFPIMMWLDLDSLGQNSQPSDWTFLPIDYLFSLTK